MLKRINPKAFSLYMIIKLSNLIQNLEYSKRNTNYIQWISLAYKLS